MEQKIKFQNRMLKQISYEYVKEKNLQEIGRCFAADLNHALYLMSRYCKEKELVKYYLIELKIKNSNNEIKLPTNQNQMLLIKFYKDKK